MSVRRGIAGLRPVWDVLLALLLLCVTVDVVAALVPGAPEVDFPGRYGLLGIGLFVVLNVLVGVAPRADTDDVVVLGSPVRGRWMALNSPSQRLPSHGTRTRGQLSAVDVSNPSGDASPPLVRGGLRGSRPEEYACFGAPVHAMAGGTVVRVRDRRRDHRARNTWQGLAFMLTFEGLLREAGGTGRVLGNHVVVDHGDGTFAAYAHLRRDTAAVREGERVVTGQVLGQVGNTGNTSAPHLHVQLMDRARVDAAAGLPMTWSDAHPTGQLDPTLERFARDPDASAVPGMPRNGEVFEVDEPPRS